MGRKKLFSAAPSYLLLPPQLLYASQVLTLASTATPEGLLGGCLVGTLVTGLFGKRYGTPPPLGLTTNVT